MAKTDLGKFSFVFSNISLVNDKVQIDVLRWIKKSHLAKRFKNSILLPNTSEADSLCAFCIFQEISPSPNA